ncbi:MAG: glycosyltransferase family 2 protein [Acidimicrobiales bacterium]
MTVPLVSVLVPAFRPHYLDTCIASIVGQGFTDFELIIGDDSDGDDIASVVTKWNDRRIRFERNPDRQQPGANRDFLISRASGRYLKFVFDDDFLLPRSLELLCAAAQDQRAALAFHGRYVVDEDGRVTDRGLVAPPDRVVPFPARLVFDHVVAERANHIGEPSNILLDAETLASIDQPFGLDGMRMRFLTDVALYVNFALHGFRMAAIGRHGSCFRLHTSQASATNGPLYSAGLFEWELFLRWSTDQGYVAAEVCEAGLDELHRSYGEHLVDLPELGRFVALGTGPGTEGRYLSSAYLAALADAWAVVDDRVAATRQPQLAAT